MNKELQKRIKLLNCRANAFIICLGIAAVFLLLGGVCVSDSESRIFGLILLAIAGVNIAIFVYVILAAKNDAKAFEDFLFTDEVQKIFEKYGYKSVK